MAEEKAKKKAAPKKQAPQPKMAGLPWGWLSVAFIFLFVIGFLTSQLVFPPQAEVAEVTVPVTVEVEKQVEVTVEVPMTAPPEEMSAPAVEEPTEAPPTSTPEPPPTAIPTSSDTSSLTCDPEIVSIGHNTLGTLIVVSVPGVPGGTYPALVNNYLNEECKTDAKFPDRLYCQTSRLAAGFGNIDISDPDGNLFCELKFTIP